jgi:branched-chain amino acid transport system substrate-binding protein
VKKRLSLFALLLAVVMVFAACGSTDTKEPQTTPDTTGQEDTTDTSGDKMVVRLGAELPMTGPNAGQGEMYKVGMQVALNEIKAKGGLEHYEIEVIIEDDQQDTATAMNVVNKLISNERAHVLTGPISSTIAMSTIDTIEAAKIPTMAPCWSPALTNSGFEYLTRLTPHDETAANTLFEYLTQVKEYTRIALLYVNTEQGITGLDYGKAALEKYGLDYVATATFTADDKDMSGQMLSIKQADPEVIVIWGGSDADAAVALTQTKQLLGNEIPIYGSTILGQPTMLSLVPEEYSEGLVYFTGWSPDSQTEESKKFVEEFKKLHSIGAAPSDVGARGYDAINVLAAALEKLDGYDVNAEDFSQKLNEALHTVEYEGLQGSFKFQENGDGLDSCMLVQLQDGKHVPVWPEQ